MNGNRHTVAYSSEWEACVRFGVAHVCVGDGKAGIQASEKVTFNLNQL